MDADPPLPHILCGRHNHHTHALIFSTVEEIMSPSMLGKLILSAVGVACVESIIFIS